MCWIYSGQHLIVTSVTTSPLICHYLFKISKKDSIALPLHNLCLRFSWCQFLLCAYMCVCVCVCVCVCLSNFLSLTKHSYMTNDSQYTVIILELVGLTLQHTNFYLRQLLKHNFVVEWVLFFQGFSVNLQL